MTSRSASRVSPPLVRIDRRVAGVATLILALFAAAGARARSELVIHKSGTKEYHRPGCPVIRDGKDVLALTRAQAEGRGLKAHDCPEPGGGTEEKKPEKPEDVYVDGGKYYHLEKCARLEKASKKLALDEAGRKFWPCPTCKPPIRKRPG